MSILVTKPGVLNQRDKAALRRKGIVCVEADDPSTVRLLTEEAAPIGSSGLLYAAMQAIAKDRYTGNTSETFAKLVAEWMEGQRNV